MNFSNGRKQAMREIRSGVLVSRQQGNQEAQQEFEKLINEITRGDVKGVILPNDGSQAAGPSMARGAMWGALAGLVIGIVPMLASVLMSAGAGILFVKASQIRVEGGAAPRIRLEGGTAPRIRLKTDD
jgi:hypothetical protein